MDIRRLPVYSILRDFYKLYEKNDVVVISTPTASGKTLLIPSFIERMTNKYVFTTVPRVLLAKSARKSAIKFIYGKDSKVGLLTGQSKMHKNAPLIFGTEMSFLLNKRLSTHTLIIDEAHEGKMSTEPVFYYAIDHIKRGGKLIISSATISVNKFVDFYKKKGFKVGVIELPEMERNYFTEVIKIDDVNGWILNNQENRFLIGVSGKEAGDILRSELKMYKHPIFFLHGEVEGWEEDEILNYDGPCIIMATVVAMSGITFRDLDVVVPPSEVKQMINNKLVPCKISMAEVKQWMGRTGRTKNGKALFTKDYFLNRPEYPIPEILREELPDVILTFCGIGYDLRKIQILNPPNIKNVNEGFNILYHDGVLVDKNSIELTEIGQQVMQMGDGLLKGLFAVYGDEMGIGATARKLAELISQGNPYRKCTYAYFKPFMAKYPKLKDSQHMLYLQVIEEDFNAHYINSELVNDVVKEYIKQHSIFGKGVNKLNKLFKKIDAEYKDEKDAMHLYKELLMKVSKRFIFVNGTNIQGIDVVSNMPINNKICFASLSPITLRDGILADMVTIIK